MSRRDKSGCGWSVTRTLHEGNPYLPSIPDVELARVEAEGRCVPASVFMRAIIRIWRVWRGHD